MKTNPGDALNLNDMACHLTELLPEDWEIQIYLTRGEISICLFDALGDEVQICTDDLTTNEILLEMVNHARRAEGMEPGTIPGLGYFRTEGDERFYQVAPLEQS